MEHGTLQSRSHTFAALTALVALALILPNFHYFFQARLFEQGDEGANSLIVLQAKKFRAIYGQYSRWGFHHPGPAFFYCYAAGEALFYDALKIVPTPFNGQTLTGVMLMSAFFAAAITAAAHWIKCIWFIPVALLFATVYFSEVGRSIFLSIWPAWVMVMPFYCMVVTAASVSAGRGEDLPLLALTCGFMVHSHVAQPLFVLPLSVIAYAGLAASSRNWKVWRRFPRQHMIAAGITLLFCLPVLIDLCRGGESNFSLILRHMRAYSGERHSLLDAVCYFLHYGACVVALPGTDQYLPGASWRTFELFLQAHAPVLLLWLALAASCPLLIIGPRFIAWRQRGPRAENSLPPANAPIINAVRVRTRFLAWLSFHLAASTGLSVLWGILQDGEMYYFNAFFNYAIYFILATLGAASLAVGLDRVVRKPLHSKIGAVALSVVVAGVFLLRASHFKVDTFDNEECRRLVRTVQEALRSDGSPSSRPRFLSFTQDAWPLAVAVALQLERMHYEPRVSNACDVIFSQRGRMDPTGLITSENPSSIWRIRSTSEDAAAARLPLGGGYGIDLRAPRINPAETCPIFFAADHHNFEDYTLCGWSSPFGGSPYTWNQERYVVMSFRAIRVDPAAHVELILNIMPFIVPGKSDSQRVELAMNGAALGMWRLEKHQVMKVAIPAEVWNSRPEGVLVWYFPDGTTPASLGLALDTRPLALAIGQMVFHETAAP